MTSDHSPVSPGSSTSSPRFIFPDMHPSSSSGHLGSDSGSSPFMSPVKREVKWEVGTPPQSSELDPAMQQVGRQLLVSQPLCFLFFLFSITPMQQSFGEPISLVFLLLFFCTPPMQQVGREFLISPHVFVVVVVIVCVFFLGGGGGCSYTTHPNAPMQSHTQGPFCIAQLSCSFQANIGTVLEAALGNCIELDLRVVLFISNNYISASVVVSTSRNSMDAPLLCL